MDINALTLPVLIAMLLGKALKSHEGVPNRLIPWLLLVQQVLQELAKQLQAGAMDPVAAANSAIPVVAGAVLAHQSGKGVLGFLKKAVPAVLKVFVKAAI